MWGSRLLPVLSVLRLLPLSSSCVYAEDKPGAGSCVCGAVCRRGTKLRPICWLCGRWDAPNQADVFIPLAALWHTQFLCGFSALQVGAQGCTYPCQCPSQPLQCPAGTSHVLDACGCCKVCARQLGELCSLQKPCDHHKGLYCDFSNIHRGSGICLGERAMPSVPACFSLCACDAGGNACSPAGEIFTSLRSAAARRASPNPHCLVLEFGILCSTASPQEARRNSGFSTWVQTDEPIVCVCTGHESC